MPLPNTQGAITAKGYGFTSEKGPFFYIEDVFSTYIYSGNGGTQTITTDVDLSNYGGLVWIKNRNNTGGVGHALTDTARGAGTGTTNTTANIIATNSTSTTGGLPSSGNDYLSAFSSTGFTVVAGTGGNNATRVTNRSADNYVAWTFREQPKFFDIVTYTGTGANRTVAHNLGSVPGLIIVKNLSGSFNWQVYHRSLAATEYLVLNSNAAKATGATRWNSTAPTSTVFSLGTDTTVNANGSSYIAYIFAHDSGGFGVSDTDNVITCDTFTTDGSGNATETLGYEPQWVLIKNTAATGDWIMLDTMRGWANNSGADNPLFANTDGAETTPNYGTPTATGFTVSGLATNTVYVYMAIRRGPMKVPSLGTSVFSAKTYSATTTSASVTHDVAFDAEISANMPTAAVSKFLIVDSLRGMNARAIVTQSVNTETYFPAYWDRKDQKTMYAPSAFDDWWASSSGTKSHVSYGLVRAPKFFDIVCYTGTGSNRTITHNLSDVPELMLVKTRSGSTGWQVYSSALANTEYLVLNTNAAKATGTTRWNSTTPTSSVFSLGTASEVNTSAATYVAYLFSTCRGVSKVGSYTGTGTTLQIDCGFTGGARFVMIKRTDSTGDWYVWDSARGIVAGNDPYLLLNSLNAEVTSTDYVDTYSAGFEISSTAPAAINANGGAFIFLAIA